MVPDAGGNITVSYIVTLPYVEQSSGELEPIVPLKTVQPSDVSGRVRSLRVEALDGKRSN